MTDPNRPAPPAPGPPAPGSAAPAPARRPSGWLIAFVVLAVALVVSAVVLFSVERPPAYEPVPVPSVSST